MHVLRENEHYELTVVDYDSISLRAFSWIAEDLASACGRTTSNSIQENIRIALLLK